MGEKHPSSAEIRQQFLDFFAERGHTIVPSAPLVPHDDPTLLFTNAGMNQFKDVFLGIGTRPYKRAADTQKCMRVSGKHNDLEDVGRSPYHHTFFEMLGNWSFGDYYKKEAIQWAWELLTQVWHLPKERLWATVFRDDQGDLGTDEEAAECWRTVTDIDPSHILYFGRKDNFWEMGDTGPCGPCSEIHLDLGPEACDRKDTPGHVCRVNGDCRRFIELWNLVFIQYNRHEDGTLDPLPEKHVDTGMGFERLVAVLQGVPTNYDTDLFMPIMRRVQELLGHTDADRQANIVPYRVIADHGRAITFLIGDGVLPGNEGRNYVLRMILRRAARFGRKLGFQKPFLTEIAQVVIDQMGDVFDELRRRREFILTTIQQEEERFLRTLDRGLERIEEEIAALRKAGKTEIPGHIAFSLWSQDGFPLDLTRDIAREHGMTVDEAGFHTAMEEHRQISGAGVTDEIQVDELNRYNTLLERLRRENLLGPEGVEHVYDETVEVETKIIAILRDGQPVRAAHEGDEIEVVLPVTPFYVESGGQVDDTGFIEKATENEEEGWEIEVTAMHRPVPDLILHIGKVVSGTPRVGDPAWAVVDIDRRWDIARNHTATHLLHSELRYVLGEHVQQAGSLVAPDRLRFDFTHGTMLSQEQLDEVEYLVNAAILADYPVHVETMPYQQAIAEGAIALFGEKYGDTVRVLKIGYEDEWFSKELCGGTHVSHTSQIGLFRILSESSVGAGVRRIEAVTGRWAQKLAQQRLNMIDQVAAYLGCQPDEIGRRVLALLDELNGREKEIDRLRRQLAQRDFDRLLAKIQEIHGVAVLATRVEADRIDRMREMCDWFRSKVKSGVIVLGAVIDGRPQLVASVTEDLVQRGIHAGNLVKTIAQTIGGSGGGRPTMAQAGGRNTARLNDALQQVPDLINQILGAEQA